MNITSIFKSLFLAIVIGTIALTLNSYSSINKKDKSFVKGVSLEDSWAQKQLSEMTLEEKIGQFFMVPAYSNQGAKHLQEVEDLVKNQKVGGIIFFQGERDNLKSSINRFQAASKIPLLVGMDAEWGIQMRIYGEERFPYAYTIGAANDLDLSERIGAMMAQRMQRVRNSHEFFSCCRCEQ
jgi:beta-N-acetylhexosaminidase